MTHNTRDFVGSEQFGIAAISPAAFLGLIGETHEHVSLHLPDSIREKIEEVARKDGISVDQFVASAVAGKLASEDYLEQRARRSTREAFERALAQVPDVTPDPGDEPV